MSRPFDPHFMIDPIKVISEREIPHEFTHEVRALFSMRELVARAQYDILPFVITQLGTHIEGAVMQYLMTNELAIEKLVLEAVKNEIRTQVKDVIAQRIDEFVEEVL